LALQTGISQRVIILL